MSLGQPIAEHRSLRRVGAGMAVLALVACAWVALAAARAETAPSCSMESVGQYAEGAAQLRPETLVTVTCDGVTIPEGSSGVFRTDLVVPQDGFLWEISSPRSEFPAPHRIPEVLQQPGVYRVVLRGLTPSTISFSPTGERRDIPIPTVNVIRLEVNTAGVRRAIVPPVVREVISEATKLSEERLTEVGTRVRKGGSPSELVQALQVAEAELEQGRPQVALALVNVVGKLFDENQDLENSRDGLRLAFLITLILLVLVAVGGVTWVRFRGQRPASPQPAVGRSATIQRLGEHTQGFQHVGKRR